MPTKIQWVKPQGEYCGECPKKDKHCDSYCTEYKCYTEAEIDNGVFKFVKCFECRKDEYNKQRYGQVWDQMPERKIK